ITAYLNDKETKAIFDKEIRELIFSWSEAKDPQLRKELHGKIHERRRQIGLNVRETFWKVLDLSYLDLSNMTLTELDQKGAICKKTDFSSSTLIECSFSRGRFLHCGMKKTKFIKCNFIGEKTAFYQTRVENAEFSQGCALEKGSTWQRIADWDAFKLELKARGALDADTVRLIQD